jgi:hypothetical protein
MKLWEYVLKYDKKSGYIKWLSEREETTPELIIKESYCPGAFDCFNKTEFKRPLYPYSRGHEQFECKCQDIESSKKCVECWDREIEDDYELYLKLKEKFDKQK